MDRTKLYKNRDEFIKALKNVFKEKELPLDSRLLKILLSGLSEKDETADICKILLRGKFLGKLVTT
ncbi:MAG: hypothetical protein HPY70_06750 [Firmicutes bacterium]|jgi:type I restriction enzyme M protein|nr:hypothetical protein [Bacillota bacterium]